MSTRGDTKRQLGTPHHDDVLDADALLFCATNKLGGLLIEGLWRGRAEDPVSHLSHGVQADTWHAPAPPLETKRGGKAPIVSVGHAVGLSHESCGEGRLLLCKALTPSTANFGVMTHWGIWRIKDSRLVLSRSSQGWRGEPHMWSAALPLPPPPYKTLTEWRTRPLTVSDVPATSCR